MAESPLKMSYKYVSQYLLNHLIKKIYDNKGKASDENKQLLIYCITEVAPDGIEHPAQAGPQPLGVPARLHGRLRIKYTSMYPPPFFFLLLFI
jgi:hypothetical protein